MKRYWRFVRRYPLPIWAGFATLGALQWRHITQRPPPPIDESQSHLHDLGGVPKISLSQELAIECYKILPLRSLSRAWGWVNEIDLPEPLRPAILGLYARVFGCNVGEAMEPDLKSYANLGQFFRRRLRPECRPIEACPQTMVSPCDGRVLTLGPVAKDGYIEQVKGVRYSLRYFFGGELPSQTFEHDAGQLYYAVIYLSPGDYHGFHSPVEWTILKRKHFSGHLLSVSPSMVKNVPGLFSLNERVIYEGVWNDERFFSYSAIGATNVGSIRVDWDNGLVTNRKRHPVPVDEKLFSEVKLVKGKGEYFGEFNLGSTIVLVFEAPESGKFQVDIGDKVKLGEPLFKS
ncbi:hypothetical protein TCAL_04183 [Tigriopus californicus]|uniref:phosphatidylserine decarboxylase n=1 Tax=Tigriopus californicus TaxID=6832 RepID=A0A553N749_TIGCA|nr:uncharacterized protein LOC131885939 [Tigriopus californicus]TRY61261.1 hypothetical protein TCAL_04183 [Tigriopus californicus]|eukprot:TCALIF_04183-PA protein Name:"Similar to PISD Phosphatidylserine decarboxylase proenzyme (Pongo abelii)" AED:0.01 eAED:0.05 QI:0/-1/0/1/-1/1/1/0/345